MCHEILFIFRVQSDADIIEFLRANTETCYHPTSSCKIGADDLSVLDEDFKVKAGFEITNFQSNKSFGELNKNLIRH